MKLLFVCLTIWTMQNVKKPTKEEIVNAAKEWAKFLYSEYCLEKNLRNENQSNTIETATNHDKLNT